MNTPNTKTGRGRKICPSCNGVNGPRQHICKHCNYQFHFKTKNSEIKKPDQKPFSVHKVRRKRTTNGPKEISNWEELNPGDTFRIIQGTGPYFVSKEGESAGEKVYIGANGHFVVESLDKNGIHAKSVTKRGHGYAFIYMGPEKYNPSSGITRASYRLMRESVRTIWA